MSPNKKSEEESVRRDLEKERRRLQETLTISSGRAEGYRGALAAVLRIVCEASNWTYAEAWLVSRDGSILKPGPVWPRIKPAFDRFREHSRKLGFHRGSGLPGRVLQSRAPEWVEDVSTAAKSVYARQELARDCGLKAALAIPVLTGEEVLAVVVFYAREALPRDAARMDFVTGVLAPLGPFLERKKIEEELLARARQQEAVARLGVEALQQAADIDHLGLNAVSLVSSTLEVEFGEVLELVPESGTLRIRASRPPADPATVADDRDSHAGYTLRVNEPVRLEDVLGETRFTIPERLKKLGIGSGVCVVIHGHSRPIGVLGVYTGRRRRFTGIDVSFLQGVANVLGTAIERSRVEMELERLVAERTTKLEESHEQLRLSERLASIGTLAAGLGHDMKNVLLPILCRLDALEEGPLTDAARKEVRAVRRSLEYLRRLSRGLRLFALDPADPEASDGTTRLGEWWQEVGPLLERAVPRGVSFTAEIPGNLPAICVPGHRLTQAVLNLVVNAGQATMGKGKVRMWAQAEGRRWVRFGVTDDGHGMSRDVQLRALEPFFTTQKRGLSTGLGLSLVHGVAQSAGGSVQIDSAPGRGTTVVLKLPAVEAPAPALPISKTRGSRIASVSLADPRAAALVSTLLRSAGFQVRRAPGAGRLWITDSGADYRGPVLRFLDEDADRRVILLGKPPWPVPGARATFVEDPLDLEGLRRSLRATVNELQETSDVA